MIPQSKSIRLLLLFSLTLFLSAFLLFWMQLMVGKMVLPLLGGSPAIWNTCLFFFQATLLLGYGYAHLNVTQLGIKGSLALHSILLLLPLPFLPIALHPPVEAIAQTNPILWLLTCLLISVGLPFFVVSTTAPLMQRWLSYTSSQAGEDPYFLYAASNLGSLLGLMGYPLGIEPLFSLTQQRWLWTAGYAGLMLLTLGCALSVRRFLPISLPTDLIDQSKIDQSKTEASLKPGTPDCKPADPAIPAPTWVNRGQWVWLAFLPSTLLLGVTTYITTDLAAVPLLWAVPLMIYLLTFILAFSNQQAGLSQPLAVLLPLVLTPLSLLFLLHIVQPWWLLVPLHALGLFLVAGVFHGELAHQRPHPAYLTEFYFWIALGGVLGGWVNAIAAPLLFPTVLEYPLAMVLSLMLLFASPFFQLHWGVWQMKGTLLLSVGLLGGGLLVGFDPQGSTQGLLALALAWGAFASLSYMFSFHPVLWIVGFLLIGLLNQFSLGLQNDLLVSDRSFFGVYRIVADQANGGYHSLLHGTTLHGEQSLDPDRRQEPLTYYTPSGPIGQLFEALKTRSIDQVGVLGLGVGTIATYGQAGERWTFYEIDPLATQLATDPRYFTFLQDSPATIDIVSGDGRLALSQSPDQTYDLLFIDAFNSDSIPVHLITQEAIQLYLTKLKPDGLLIINITNRFLNLEPMLGAMAHRLGLVSLAQAETDLSESDRLRHKTPCHWVILTSQPENVGLLSQNPKWYSLPFDPQTSIWTDDFSNILQVLQSAPSDS